MRDDGRLLDESRYESRCKVHFIDFLCFVDSQVPAEVEHIYAIVDKPSQDSQEHTLEFFPSPKRDVQAAKRFFAKALNAFHTATPTI